MRKFSKNTIVTTSAIALALGGAALIPAVSASAEDLSYDDNIIESKKSELRRSSSSDYNMCMTNLGEDSEMRDGETDRRRNFRC